MATESRKDNKGRKLRPGEYQDASKRYCFKWTDSNGKRRTVYSLTLQELREKEQQIQQDLADGIDSIKASEMTLNSAFGVYLESKANLRPTTRANYARMWSNRVENSDLGKMKVESIKKLHIDKFYIELKNEGLAMKTIKLLHALILPTLEMLVDSDIIRKNPARNCQISGSAKKREALTRDQQERFTAFLDASEQFALYAPMIHFALATGLRVGELTGLRWDDIITSEGIAKIQRQLIYKNLGEGTKFYLQENTKTEAGRRDIYLTSEARHALNEQRKLLLMLGLSGSRKEVCGVDDFVFVNSKGRVFAANAINWVLKSIVDAYNEANPDKEPLPHISAHILRHTCCSRMAEAGVMPKALQEFMGHSDISVTMNIYTNLDKNITRQEIAKIDRISQVS